MKLSKLFKIDRVSYPIYEIPINRYINDTVFYAILVDRRNEPVDYDRRMMLLVLNSRDIQELKMKRKIEKQDLFLNPLQLVIPYEFTPKDIPWKKIDEIKISVDIIQGWPLKMYMSPIGHLENVLINERWCILLNDKEKILYLQFDPKWSNLDFFDLYYFNYSVDFRIALEVCRLKGIKYEDGIINFKKTIEEDYVHRAIVNHVEYVDVYQLLPDHLKGYFDPMTAVPYKEKEVKNDKKKAGFDPFKPNTISDELYEKFKSLSFDNQIKEIRKRYPFERWHQMHLEDKSTPHTKEVCTYASQLMDDLLSKMESAGVGASDEEKKKHIGKTVILFNELNEKCGLELIETMEREELCEVFDLLGVAYKMDFSSYDEGDDITSDWREW